MAASEGGAPTIIKDQLPSFMVKEEEEWLPQLRGPENLRDWLLSRGHAAGTRAFGTLRKYKALDAPAMVKASILMIAGDPNFRRSIHDWVFKETSGAPGLPPFHLPQPASAGKGRLPGSGVLSPPRGSQGSGAGSNPRCCPVPLGVGRKPGRVREMGETPSPRPRSLGGVLPKSPGGPG